MPKALRLLWLLALLVATPVMAQTIMERLITPGELSSAHAKLESKCDSCHSSFRKEAQNRKCVACHKEVGADISGRKGYHGKSGSARTGACKSCHSDHKGRGYALVRLNRSTFNHDLTDYPLAGAHKQVKCAQCHGTGNDYRGITRSCIGCHKDDDPHRGQLGRNCQDCHTVASWKQVKAFSHTQTGFSLTGAHSQATCLSCHTGQRWKGLSGSCIGCHRKDDLHRGSRGTNCADCHTTSSWQTVRFDHAGTKFPLIGAHAAASCTSCHGRGNSTPKPATDCISCHTKDNVHEKDAGTDCAACHGSRSWTRISFDHARKTAFALLGAHRSATCSACHQPQLKLLKPEATCFGCHEQDDEHKGGNGKDCGRCHGETDWSEVDFNHDTMTRFALAGKHAQAPCESCHIQPADEVKLALECGSCHASDDVHAGNLGENCGRCHGSNEWVSEVRFDHDLTRFPLLGKHAQSGCQDCHSDRSYASQGVACASCHIDDHHRGSLGTPSQCRDCHNSMDWKAWSFDHDTATRFELTGQHRGLVCSACHSRAGDPSSVGTACIDCHRRDDIHRGGFGEDCERCHVTADFGRIILPESQN
jgi:hypothetical protein